MPGYHVHSFFTAAVFDCNDKFMPAGLVVLELVYALLFMSHSSHDLNNYDVHTV